MEEQEYQTFNLKDIKGEQLEEVAKYLAGFLGSIAGFYLGKNVYTKIMGEASEIEDLKERLLEGKVAVSESEEVQEQLEQLVESEELESLEQLEDVTGVRLFDDNEEG
jgi:hypothetical protein